LKVFISDIIVRKSKYDDSNLFFIMGELQSGLELCINDNRYYPKDFIGHQVEMLLCVKRSPFLERGMNEKLFLSDEYCSVELIDELKKKRVLRKPYYRKELELTGKFIDSYTIPEDWIPLIKSKFFRGLLKDSSALETEHGIFPLSPFHLTKRVPIEEFPQEVTIATGRIDLAAWHPI